MEYKQDNVNHTNLNHNNYGNPHTQYVGNDAATSITNASNRTVCRPARSLVWNAITITLNKRNNSKYPFCKCICNYKMIMDYDNKITKGEFTIRLDTVNNNIYTDGYGMYNVFLVNTVKKTSELQFDIYIEMPSNEAKCYLIKEFVDGENYYIDEHNFKLIQSTIQKPEDTRILSTIPYDNCKRTKPMTDPNKNYVVICEFNSLVALGEKLDTTIKINRHSISLMDCAYAEIRIIYDYTSGTKDINGRIIDMYGMEYTDVVYTIQAGKISIFAKLRTVGDYYTIDVSDTIETTKGNVDSPMKIITNEQPIGLYDVESPVTFIPINKRLCVTDSSTGSVYELKVINGQLSPKLL